MKKTLIILCLIFLLITLFFILIKDRIAINLKNKGVKLYKEKNYSEAIEYFNLTKLYKKDFETYEYIGRAYEANGDLKKAIESYSKSIKLTPINYKNYSNQLYYLTLYRIQSIEKYLIETNFQDNDQYYFDIAYRDCSYLVKEYPDSLSPLYLRAEFFRMDYKFESALRDANSLISIEPTNLLFLGLRTFLNYALDNLEEVKKDIDLIDQYYETPLTIIIFNASINIIENKFEDIKYLMDRLEIIYNEKQTMEDDILLLLATYHFYQNNITKAKEFYLKSKEIGNYKTIDEYTGIILKNKRMNNKVLNMLIKLNMR